MLLREACAQLGKSRTTVQSWMYDILKWEKQDEKDNTALEISEEDMKKLWAIRFYRELNISNERIRRIFADPDYDTDRALESSIRMMRKQRMELDRLINAAEYIHETGVTPDTMQKTLHEGVVNRYDTAMTLLSMNGQQMRTYFKDANPFEDGELDVMIEWIEQFVSLWKEGKAPDDGEVQQCAAEIHHIFTKPFGNMIEPLNSTLDTLLASETEREEFDAEYGDGAMAFFLDAMKRFCATHRSRLEVEYEEAMEAIERYFLSGEPNDSKKVLHEAEKCLRMWTAGYGGMVPGKSILVNMIRLFSTVRSADAEANNFFLYFAGALRALAKKIA